MVAALRPLRAVAMVLAALVMVAPCAAGASPKGFGVLIEYAANVPEQNIKMLENILMSFFRSGL